MYTVISPLYYLPPISCYAAYVQNERPILEACEHYQKGSWRNKCAIGTAQGALLLSIPLLRGKHQSLDIQKVRISNYEDWKTQHWRSIRTAYSNAPFFEHYDFLFESVYQGEWEVLWEFNWALLKVVDQCLGISIDWQISTEYSKEVSSTTVDLRSTKRPKLEISIYPQVHEGVVGFQSDMCILDLIFHLGPEAVGYLKQQQLNSIPHNG